KTGS
ncbi:hypothetical protein CP061683_0631B, partial [Chlamydia psittaci 06-1683]